MPYMGVTRTRMLEALIEELKVAVAPKYVGLLERGAAKAVKSSSTKKIELTGSLANGTLVVFTVLKKGTGLVVGRPYYVVGKGANDFELSLEEGGTSETWTEEVETSSELSVVKEVAGGSYKRLATAFAKPALAVSTDSTLHSIAVPASTINYISYHTAETVGTLVMFGEVTQEVFAGSGTYSVTSSKADLLAYGNA